MPAYANGQRFLFHHGPERKTYSDPDASWGHRSAVSTRKGGGFYGYRIHAAVCARTGLPLAWEVKTAREHESLSVVPLLDALDARGFAPETAALDRGYDLRFVYDACAARGIAPIIPLRETGNVKRGHHRPPECEHGTWTFAGADFKRKRAQWREISCSAREVVSAAASSRAIIFSISARRRSIPSKRVRYPLTSRAMMSNSVTWTASLLRSANRSAKPS